MLEEAHGYQVTLLTLDMDLLKEHLSALPCRHLLAVLDCCSAGAFRWSMPAREPEPVVDDETVECPL